MKALFVRLFHLLFLFTFLFSCKPEPTLQYSGDLEIGLEKPGALQKNEVDTFLLQLEAGTFLHGYVNQIDVDVVVGLKDEENKLLKSFDAPARGPEQFSFDIDKAGKYLLEVKPFKEKEGNYSILLEEVSPIATDPQKRVDQLMTAYSGDVPGAVVGVVKDGEMLFSKAYGKANLTHDLDFKLDMPTNIGSVSKQFTAMAVLLLEKAGKLSLEDDVRKYIPELPDLGKVVKVKNILNHTNGWREVYNLMPIRGWYGEDKLLKEEVLNILQQQPEFQTDPGEEFNYNNSAFIMAAEIVERVSEKDFPDFVKENIFDPLGMTNSYVRRDPSTIIPNATQGYSNGDHGFIESGDLDAAYGAGAIYTTPGDLMKWMNNFEHAKVGGPEFVKKLITPDTLNNGDTMTYALGIGIGEYKGVKRYSHGGADIAHRAMLVYFPDLKSGVVTLSNNAGFSGALANEVADIFFGEHLEVEEEAKEENSEKFTMSEETLKQYAGKYKAEEQGLIIEYKLEEGQLVAIPAGQSPINLEPVAENSFAYSGIAASLQFHADEDGQFTRATHTQGGSDLNLIKLPPYDPTIEALSEFSGRYFCEELETYYTLKVKDSTLIAVHRNMKEIKLTPTEEDAFNGDVFFIGEMAFQRNQEKEVTGFTVSNGRTKGILFERL